MPCASCRRHQISFTRRAGVERPYQTSPCPHGAFAGPVGPNQQRVVREEADGRAKAFILTGLGTPAVSCQQVLDDAVKHAPLLVLGLDQGSVGAAGAGFYQYFLGFLVLIASDKIHKLMWDVNLAVLHACGGIFYKARLYSQHWLGINSKPF